MPKVITMGEALIDFIPGQVDCPLSEVEDFKRAPGGAPANVAVGLARLGVKAGFMGKVGQDAFGVFLKKTLVENRVDTSQLIQSRKAMTTLAFVSLRSDGERDFAFYRNPGADNLYRVEEVDLNYLSQASVFHFGSITLISEPVRTTTIHLVKEAQKRNLLISFDPNIRPPLWPSINKAVQEILGMLPEVILVKVNEEELFTLTGQSVVFTGIDSRFIEACAELERLGPEMIAVTLGARGSYFYTRQVQGYVPGFSCRAVDTTGAGDGFMAGLITKIMERNKTLSAFTAEDCVECFRFANRVGAIAATRNGGIPSLPTLTEVQKGVNLYS